MIAFGLVAIIPFVAKGRGAGEEVVSLPQFPSMYFLTAVLAGGLLGVLRPLSQPLLGGAVIGFLTGTIAGISFHLATSGVGHWQGFDAFLSGVLSLWVRQWVSGSDGSQDKSRGIKERDPRMTRHRVETRLMRLTDADPRYSGQK